MNNDQMREEFERLMGVGWIESAPVCACWKLSWISSRAALCVELPKPAGEWYGCPSVDGYNMALNKCRTAIESTGVRTR